MGEWSVGQWIVGVISFQKMYGLYGLKSIYIGINAHVTDAGRTDKQTTTSEDRATQLLICEPLSLAIWPPKDSLVIDASMVKDKLVL